MARVESVCRVGGKGMTRLFILSHSTARRNAIQAIQEAPDGDVVTIKPPKKSRAQEEKYHAMFDDIARQVPLHGVTINEADMKRALFSAFKIDTKDDPDLAKEWREFGEVRMAVGFRGEIIVFGDQTRKLPKKLASALIEWLYAFGAEHDVVWSEPGAAKPRRIDMETGEILGATHA